MATSREGSVGEQRPPTWIERIYRLDLIGAFVACGIALAVLATDLYIILSGADSVRTLVVISTAGPVVSLFLANVSTTISYFSTARTLLLKEQFDAREDLLKKGLEAPSEFRLQIEGAAKRAQGSVRNLRHALVNAFPALTLILALVILLLTLGPGPLQILGVFPSHVPAGGMQASAPQASAPQLTPLPTTAPIPTLSPTTAPTTTPGPAPAATVPPAVQPTATPTPTQPPLPPTPTPTPTPPPSGGFFQGGWIGSNGSPPYSATWGLSQSGSTVTGTGTLIDTSGASRPVTLHGTAGTSGGFNSLEIDEDSSAAGGCVAHYSVQQGAEDPGLSGTRTSPCSSPSSFSVHLAQTGP